MGDAGLRDTATYRAHGTFARRCAVDVRFRMTGWSHQQDDRANTGEIGVRSAPTEDGGTYSVPQLKGLEAGRAGVETDDEGGVVVLGGD